MSYGATSGQSSQNSQASSYRIKFYKNEFLELLGIAQPRIVYKVKNFYYFAFDGFVMYCSQVKDNDLISYTIIQGIEFSNISWTKK